jgi:Peptidase family C25
MYSLIMKKQILFQLLFAALVHSASAQMWTGTDTLYGNEWIDHNKPYFKIRIGEEGLYRIPQSLLTGTELADKPAEQLRLYGFGQQVPIYISTALVMGSSDFIEFYADKNRNQIDKYLFDNAAAQQVNPRYSMFQDSATYYLTWETQTPALRFNALPNTPTAGATPLAWCWYSVEQVFHSNFVKKRIGEQTTYSWFDGNGFASPGSTLNTATLSLPNLFNTGPSATATLRYACDLGQHAQQFIVNEQVLSTDEFSSFAVKEQVQDLPLSLLSSGTANIKLYSSLGGNDRNHLAFVKVRYPRELKFGNANNVFFELPASTEERYLEIKDFNSGASSPLLFDLTEGNRLVCFVENGVLRVQLPPANTTTRLLLVHPEAGVRNVAILQKKQFEDFKATSFDYAIISNPALYGNGSSTNYAQQYADYRASAAGGGHKVRLIDVNELYEQFAYGTRFHPLSIRNFLHWAKKQHPQFEHVFLLGKALEHKEFRTPSEQAMHENQLFFVPTYSSPGADLPFTLKGNRLGDPVVAIGRLAVTTPEDISLYLDKVREHEQQIPQAEQNIAGKAWMKRVLHNSGGGAGETALIKGYTTGMANILENDRFGAEVSAFYKTSNDPIQLSGYEQILKLVNGGVSIWSIFGHSSANAVDFDIGAPENYNNKGRYPFMVVMGCFSGLCSNTQDGLGERFVLAKDRGAIAYVASVNYSFLDALNSYAKEYYRFLGGPDYGKSIGVAMQHTIAALKGTQSSSLIAVLHQNLMQGDPAIKLNLSHGPDYTLDPDKLRFTPNPVSLEESRTTLDIDVVNLGENTGGDLILKVEQRLPNGIVALQRILDTIAAPGNRASLRYDLDLQGSAVGFNRFYVRLDPANAIDELPAAAAEANNDIRDASGEEGQDIYVFAEDVQPIWPAEFGIAAQKQVILHASSLNANAVQTRYLFEIDSVETFNSPLKKSGQVKQGGGLIQWKVPFDLTDSTTYYWRVGRDSLVNGTVVWRNRSFLYLKDSPLGWNQSHYGQFRGNDFSNMLANDSLRRLEFVDNSAFSNISVAYRGLEQYPGLYNGYSEGMRGDYGFNIHGLDQGVLVAVSDPANGRYWLNPIGGPYSFDPPYDRYYYWFLTRDSLQRIRLMDFLENVVPEGHYVSLLATGLSTDSVSYAPQRWAMDSTTYGKNLFQVLEKEGALRVRKTVNFTTAPPAYAFFYRKGSFGLQSVDTINANPDIAIEMRVTFLAKWPTGFWENKKIGPARKWSSLHWDRAAFDDSSDESDLYVYGVRPVEGDTLLFKLKNTFDTTLLDISAARFPYLKVRHEMRDTVARSVTPLRYLRVLFEGLPEAALDPSSFSQFYADTLQQGETLSAAVAFANVSGLPMDSLLVRFKIDGPGTADLSTQKWYKAMAAGDSVILSFQAPTKGMEGPQRLIIDANPDNEQPEAYHFNNVLIRDFYVGRDLRNPLLDVTFDGQHILDGDLISPKPEVVITLKDDNKYLAIQDTTTFSMSLVQPDGNSIPIAYGDPQVQFFPANAAQLPKKNLARLEWRPIFTQDGEYRLLVNGRDASGNESADLDWALTFKVITKSSISNVLNYPNPFSTSTCFYYTMTGAEPPVNFKVQIMTVSGRVVREVTEAEFGPMRAGKQRSDFCWDGRDQFGDQLANGVYLYRIVAKKADGSDFEFFENEQIDGFFKHGFGKMMLMR